MMRKKLLFSFLAVSLIAPQAQAGIVSTVGPVIESAYSSFYNSLFDTKSHRIMFTGAAALFFAGLIRLNTKRCTNQSEVYAWKDLLKVWNALDSKYWNGVDALIVGEPLKFEEVTTSIKESDNTSVKIKGKRVKNKPKGILGCVQAYFLDHIDTVIKHVNNIDKIYDRTANFINNGKFE